MTLELVFKDFLIFLLLSCIYVFVSPYTFLHVFSCILGVLQWVQSESVTAHDLLVGLCFCFLLYICIYIYIYKVKVKITKILKCINIIYIYMQKKPLIKKTNNTKPFVHILVNFISCGLTWFSWKFQSDILAETPQTKRKE